jgi:hypothetical protein
MIKDNVRQLGPRGPDSEKITINLGYVDVSAKLARATISSITVLGALHASAEVKAALADRIQ